MSRDTGEPVSGNNYEISDAAEALQILDSEGLSVLGVAALRRLIIAGRSGDPEQGSVDDGLDWLEIRAKERQILQAPDIEEPANILLAPAGTAEGILQRRLLSIRDDKDEQTAIFATGMLGSLNASLKQSKSPGTDIQGETIMAGIMHQGHGLLASADRFLWELEVATVGPERNVRLPFGTATRRVELQESSSASTRTGSGIDSLISRTGSADFVLAGVNNIVARVKVEEVIAKHARAAYSSTPRENLTILLVKQPPVTGR